MPYFTCKNHDCGRSWERAGPGAYAEGYANCPNCKQVGIYALRETDLDKHWARRGSHPYKMGRPSTKLPSLDSCQCPSYLQVAAAENAADPPVFHRTVVQGTVNRWVYFGQPVPVTDDNNQ